MLRPYPLSPDAWHNMLSVRVNSPPASRIPALLRKQKASLLSDLLHYTLN